MEAPPTSSDRDGGAVPAQAGRLAGRNTVPGMVARAVLDVMTATRTVAKRLVWSG